ncbi:CoA-transferase family III domain-containing protein [Lipomyces starkeyi]|uniref:CoA-transferase family III n=1 Tax=Lipomyces starkeyi NRRL Y-11557 TaxID=675824 RepID=A0A1E3PYX1_LIPST|nr:hypothetical protein LIPSTDRAFT_6051 [Lipomyces starkeyi NRRL Y-11557]
MFRKVRILKLSRLSWTGLPSFSLCRYSSTAADPHVALPLTGFRVVDLTRASAGPYATQILADLGAEVIKVEHVTRGDDTRPWGPPFAKSLTDPDSRGESAFFLSVNRNKKSLGLNFKEKRGQSILKSLIGTSDVVIDNYLPGTLAKYYLGYEQLKNDRIIYAKTVPDTGSDITGEADGAPVKVGVVVTDVTTGLYAANSIMAAIISRSRTGLGQYIDIALSDCQIAALSNIQPDAGRLGTSHASICPYQAFPTKDGSIMIGAANDRLYGLMCQLLDREEWIVEERFTTNTLLVKHRSDLVPVIVEETKKKTTEEWLDLFEGSGIPYAAINDIQATLNHPQVLARNMIAVVEHPTCGPLKLVNTPIKYSAAKPTIREAPPTLG